MAILIFGHINQRFGIRGFVTTPWQITQEPQTSTFWQVQRHRSMRSPVSLAFLGHLIAIFEALPSYFLSYFSLGLLYQLHKVRVNRPTTADLTRASHIKFRHLNQRARLNSQATLFKYHSFVIASPLTHPSFSVIPPNPKPMHLYTLNST